MDQDTRLLNVGLNALSNCSFTELKIDAYLQPEATPNAKLKLVFDGKFIES